MTKRPKIWRKLLRLYLSVGLISLLILGALSYWELSREKFFSIESNLNGQVKQLDLMVDGFFSNIEAGVLVLANNPLVRTRQDSDFTNFTQADEKTFVYHIGPTEERIIQLFALYKQYYQYVNSVYMGRENGGFVRSHKRARPTRYDPRERDWYILARENPGKVVRTKPYRSVTTDDINIGTTTALVDEEGRFYGVVGLDVTLKDLGNFVTNMKLDYDGRVALLTQDGEVLAATFTPLQGKNIKEVLPEEAAGILESDSDCRMTGSGDFLLCHGTCTRLGWKVLVITPMRVINNEVFVTSARLLAIALITLVVLGGLVAVGLQIMVISRIQRLSGKTEEITRSGKLTPVLEPGPDDEIGAMSGSFNRMVAKLQNMDDQLRGYSAELEETVRIRTALIQERTAELLEAEQRSRLLLESAGEGIFGVNLEGNLTFINPAGARILGYSVEELLHENIHRLIHHSYSDGSPYPLAECPMNATIIQGKGHHSEDYVLWRKNGTNFPVEYTSTPMYQNNQLMGAVITFSDISERKRLEAETIRAKEAAEAAAKAKSDFLANMSHELRTPLNAIMGNVHLALQTDLIPKQKGYLVKIEGASKSLLSLIQSVLDFSKIETDKLNLEAVPFRMQDVLEKLFNLVIRQARDKNLAFSITASSDVPPELIGDPHRLEQVLYNLTENAVKFTEAGQIAVSVEVVGKDHDVVTLKFTVRDTGIGLGENQRAEVFQTFTQVDASSTRKYGGAGLGLAMSKRLVEMMGGEIGVTGEDGKGSTFFFTAQFGLSLASREQPGHEAVWGAVPSIEAAWPAQGDQVTPNSALASSGGQPADRPELAALLEKLGPAVASRVPKQCLPILELMADLAWPPEIAKDLSRLDNLIRKYKFREALPLLNSIRARLPGGD
ncbi:MAG: ATP-binding protein [Thermodesulfobacteriota bacterium]